MQCLISINTSKTPIAPPSLHNAYANNFGVANSSKQCAKTSPTSNICIAIMNILLHKIWRLVDHVLIVVEAPNLYPSTLLHSHYNPPNLRWMPRIPVWKFRDRASILHYKLFCELRPIKNLGKAVTYVPTLLSFTMTPHLYEHAL